MFKLSENATQAMAKNGFNSISEVVSYLKAQGMKAFTFLDMQGNTVLTVTVDGQVVDGGMTSEKIKTVKSGLFSESALQLDKEIFLDSMESAKVDEKILVQSIIEQGGLK